METSNVTEANDVIELIYKALRQCNSSHINDVDAEDSDEGIQIILTTDNGEQYQRWIISTSGIVETEKP